MRIALALLVASLLIAPAAIAEDLTPMHEECPDPPEVTSEEHDQCHEDQDAPGFGLLAAVGALGALAFAARRRA